MRASKTVPTFQPPEIILVPCDFSRCSRAALEYACGLARLAQSEVALLHAIEPVEPAFLLQPGLTRKAQGEIRDHALGQMAAWAKEAGADVCARRALVKAGPPWQVIVTVAQRLGAGLIVVGTHGRTGLTRAMLGSVAERVMRHAPCPVLVVR